MRGGLSLTFQGDKEMAIAMQSLAVEIREKAIPRALAAAGREVVKVARSLAPSDRTADPACTLKKSLGLVARGRRGRPKYIAFGPRRGFARSVTRPIIIRGSIVGAATRKSDPANYAHLVEFGHFVVVPRAGVSLRKGDAVLSSGKSFVAARPFMRPAFVTARPAVKARFIQELSKVQTNFLLRRARRAGASITRSLIAA